MINTHWSRLFVLVAVVCIATAQSSQADGINGGTGITLDDPPLIVGADWFATENKPPAFFWGPGPGALNMEGPFTFDAATPVRLDITDDFGTGDRFEVFDFSVSLGLTSIPSGGTGGEFGPEAAFNSTVFSNGSFLLGPGAHAITIATVNNPHNTGRGYIRAMPIPEPTAIALSTWALLSLRFVRPAGHRHRCLAVAPSSALR